MPGCGNPPPCPISSCRPAAPDLPTIDQSGVPGFDVVGWVGLFAPAGTPPAVINKLNAEVRKALDAPEVKERLGALGTDVAPTTSADFDKKVGNTIEGAKRLGNLIAKRALAKNISKIVFDRSGYIYHGRIRALADAAREGGAVRGQ